MRLNIQLQIDPMCTLSATDQTSYTYLTRELNQHVSLEYLLDKDNNIVDYKVIPFIITDNSLKLPTVFKLKTDGSYTYRKLIIPTLAYFQKSENAEKINTSSITTDDVDNTFYVKDKYFEYKGNFYYSPKNLEVAEDVKDLRQVTDFNELWENKEDQNWLFFENCVFSICKIEKCLLSLQKKIIENCYSHKCGSDSDLKYKRDFMLDSVFVLKYMLSLKQYAEAQRILDNLSTCGDGSNSICGDESNNYSNCGCGNSV